MSVSDALIRLSHFFGAWLQERTWEWQWDRHPMSGLLAAWAVGVLILILFVWALVSLAPPILAIIGAVLGIRWLRRAADQTRFDSAVAILRERYARGELGKDEFDARMRDLTRR